MGNSGAKQLVPQIKDFSLLHVVGRGGFSQVWKAVHAESRELFAVKEMKKARILKKRSLQSVLTEAKLLLALRHPFLVNCHRAGQTDRSLYLVLDLKLGGDLRYQLIHGPPFSEGHTRFFMACLLLALEYLHSNAVIHRDIKPENLVFDTAGYLYLTDFGVAKRVAEGSRADTSGTPAYMAPETLMYRKYGLYSDCYAFGVVLCEVMLRKRPYPGSGRQELLDRVRIKQVQLRRPDVPPGWSPESVDLVNRLLQRRPEHRLGFNGVQEIKNHAWFRDFPWEALLQKTLPPPFQPAGTENFDQAQVLQFADSIHSSEERAIDQECFVQFGQS